MTLKDIKISDLRKNKKALEEMIKAIGTSSRPYPGTYEDDSNPNAGEQLGAIANNAHPLYVYTDQSDAAMTGLLYRDMPIPSLLKAQKAAIEMRSPDSKNRLMLILGDPGSGKSHLAKTMAKIHDTRPPIVIDCGGRYMSDLLFEQVIDYGEGFQKALTDKIHDSELSQETIDLLDDRLPGALVRDDATGKITDINWHKVSERRPTGTSTKEKPVLESSEIAAERGLKYIKLAAEMEHIPSQSTNSVGIKKQYGALIRAYQEGREIILDEYTKSVEGSDDSLQTVIQFLTGEIDECTVDNSMKVSDHEGTDSFTFRREDMKAGFFVTATGNKDSDGVSTHSLSQSANSRITKFEIEAPTSDDWKHRISQVLTGVPLSTIYSVFSGMASDEKDFSNMLLDMRTMGLSDVEKARVPQHQVTMLTNWQETRGAIDKLSDFYMYAARLVDTNSDLYQQQNAVYDAIEEEIDMSFASEVALDFRKVIQDISEAQKVKAVVKKVDGMSSLRLDFSSVGHQKVQVPYDPPEVICSEFGTRLEQVMRERISSIAGKNRPQLKAALLLQAHNLGILSAAGAPDQETIAKQLNQDALAGLGGSKNIYALRDVLINHLKKADSSGALDGQSDEEIMPTDEAVDACAELSELAAGADSSDPRKGRIILLGNDLSHKFNEVSAVDSFRSDYQPETAELVSASDFFESLKVPALAEANMHGLWRNTMTGENLFPPSAVMTPLMNIVEGTHESGVGVMTDLIKNERDGRAVPVRIIEDKARGKTLIVADEIDSATRAALSDDYTIVTYDDPAAEAKAEDFIKETLEQGRKSGMDNLETQLTSAFMLRCGTGKVMKQLKEMMVTR